jgi:hypothetical protein
LLPERFCGELNELFTKAAPFEPSGIVELMQNNQLPQLEVASTKK